MYSGIIICTSVYFCDTHIKMALDVQNIVLEDHPEFWRKYLAHYYESENTDINLRYVYDNGPDEDPNPSLLWSLDAFRETSNGWIQSYGDLITAVDVFASDYDKWKLRHSTSKQRPNPTLVADVTRTYKQYLLDLQKSSESSRHEINTI